jgi:hypothetical protein
MAVQALRERSPQGRLRGRSGVCGADCGAHNLNQGAGPGTTTCGPAGNRIRARREASTREEASDESPNTVNDPYAARFDRISVHRGPIFGQKGRACFT